MNSRSDTLSIPLVTGLLVLAISSACRTLPIDIKDSTASGADDSAVTDVDDSGGADDVVDTGCADPATWYLDADGDGFGLDAWTTQACAAPEGYAAAGGDCDDGDGAVNPEAEELCNGEDDDCDGESDVGEVGTWYSDEDGDGWGHPGESEETCLPQDGWVDQGGDCRPTDPDQHPGAVDLCDGEDNDCDGEEDEDSDADGDGYFSEGCEGGDDCDDEDEDIFPGATDVCDDGVDGDCSGSDASCGFDEETDLGDADGKFWAENRGEDAGRHMDAGDVDGDGNDDAVVGAMWADGYQGSAFILYGPVSGEDSLPDAGIELSGGATSYEGGRTIGVYDIDDDGYDDVFLGSPDAPGYDAVIFFGPVDGDANFSSADVRAWCSQPVECGHGGDTADIDGDGIGDAVIGAGEEDTGGYYAGSVFLLFGPLTSRTFDLQSVHDAELIGEQPGSETGRVVSAGPDLNADGVGDVLITASYDSTGGPYGGAVHTVMGPLDDMDLEDSDGKLIAGAAYDYIGESIAMGDVNGDGYADAIVGAYVTSRYSGHAYVVYGPATGSVSLTAADASVAGSRAQQVGSGVSAGDVNADGALELLVGASADNEGGPSSGSAYLFFGPVSGSLSPDDADSAFYGESGSDAAGTGVGFGDLDGNGYADVMVGATGESTGGASAGALYLMYAGW